MTPSASDGSQDRNLSAIIVVTALGHTLCHTAELAFAGALVAIMQEMSLSPEEATSLALPGFALMGLGALPVGFWADRWGPTRMLRFYLAATAACALAVALAPGPLGLFITLTCLVGLVGSIYHPAGLAVLAVAVPPSRRGRAMGMNGVAGSIGVALGPALGLVAAGFGIWRFAYVIIAIFALGIFLYMMMAVRIPEAEKGATPPAPVGVRVAPLAAGPGWMVLGLLFLAMMLGGFNYRCLLTALPTYLSGETTTGELARGGGLIVFVALAVGGFGQYYCGHGADRLGARRLYPWLVVLLVPLSLLLGLSEGGLLAFPVACVIAFCLFGQQPLENTIMAEWAPARRRGLSYAAKFAATFGIGAIGASVVGRLWEDYHSLTPTFYLMAVSSTLMAAIAAFLLWRAVPRAEKACTVAETDATMVNRVSAVPNN